MIHALVTGVLLRAPVPKTSARGTTYCTGLLKVPGKDGDAIVNFICFQDEAVTELLTLQAGDGLAITGHAALRTWEKDGVERTGLSVTVDRVLPNKPKPRATKPKEGNGQRQHARSTELQAAGPRDFAPPEFNDDLPDL